VDLGGRDGDLPGPPFVVEPTELGQKVLASIDPTAVNLEARRYVTPRRKDMGRVFPVGDDLGGPDAIIPFYVLEDTFVPTDQSRGYPVGKVVAYTVWDTWHVLDGFTMGPQHDEPEWDDEESYADEWAARAALEPSRTGKGKTSKGKTNKAKQASKPS